MSRTIIHQPRVAWDGARAFVAATNSDGYPWLSERVGHQLRAGSIPRLLPALWSCVLFAALAALTSVAIGTRPSSASADTDAADILVTA